jgi:hypothetical protein
MESNLGTLFEIHIFSDHNMFFINRIIKFEDSNKKFIKDYEIKHQTYYITLDQLY